MVSKAEIKEIIKSAFDGVTLDGGISLEQAKVIDRHGLSGISLKQIDALPKNEITDDWGSIPASTLDEFEDTAHLDAKGFRYYIPALMLRLLDNYDPGSMMTIGTLSALYPKTENHEHRYTELNKPQRQAIAKYLESLPTLVDLWGENKPVVERAYRNYWSKQIGE